MQQIAVRMYVSPRLLMPPMRTLPPVPLWRGVRPSEVAKSRGRVSSKSR
jgi:hypothetical protein